MPASEEIPLEKTSCPILTKREIDVLKLIAQGYNNNKIAKILIISHHTVKAHVCNILRKYGVHERILAVVMAFRAGILK